MSVTVLIGVTLWDGLAPLRTAIKVEVVSVRASVDNVDVNTLTAVLGVEVLVVGAKGQAVAVGDTGKTPRCALLKRRLVIVVSEGVNFLVPLDELDLS